ncbi:MAG TPA: FHA domain-containing protein [Acidobacteriota bacterium]|nr:FHA domain-containing protein [Acidobacteriota bacterium]
MVARITLQQYSVVDNNKEAPKEYAGDALAVGRDKNKSNIVVNCPVVSRQHAQILRYANGWAIYDCDSQNGTHVIRGTSTYEVPRVTETGKLDRMHIFTLQSGDIIVLAQKVGLKVCGWELN